MLHEIAPVNATSSRSTSSPRGKDRPKSCFDQVPWPYIAITRSDDCASLDHDCDATGTADPLAWRRRQLRGVTPTSRLNTFER